MHLPSRSIPCSLAALGAAALMAAPTTAHAQFGGKVAVSPGLSLSISFGQKVTFGLGLDVRVTGLAKGEIMPCDSNSRAGAGGYVQATWLNFSAWRFGAGAHGGGELYNQVFALDGEIGWTFHTRYDDKHPAEHGLQLGLLPLITGGIPAPTLELPMRAVIPVASPDFLPEGSLGAGARLPWIFGFSQSCVIGRPLRVGGDVLLPPVVARGRRLGWRRNAGIGRGTREALAGAWQDDARAECASVPAFLALARDLAAAGAPDALVARA